MTSPLPSDGQNIPIPDPTVLTTEQLFREIGRLEKLLDSRIISVREFIDERFNSVTTQFELIERQRVEQKKDTKDAVDAALAAAKEAVKEQTTASDRSITKSETATSEQLKQLTQTFTTALSGTADALMDVKDRVSKIETLKQGGKETVNALYIVVSALAMAVAIYAALRR
jgi:hypothetical protein